MGASSINVSFYLMKYFHLLYDLDVKIDKKDYCSRYALKNFSQLLNRDGNILRRIYVQLLLYLYFVSWQKIKSEYKDQAILYFGSAFGDSKYIFDQLMNKQRWKTFEELQKEWLKVKN